VLEPLGSAALRDKLIAELKELNTADEAAAWAHRMMRSKNSLMRKDAERVELGFQLKLSTFMTAGPKAPDSKRGTRQRRVRNQQRAINKTILALPVPRRVRDRDHVKSVAKQPCMVAVAARQTRTICALRSYRRSAARSAMSSPSRSAGDITARSIALVMKRRGGKRPASIRPSPPARYGSKHTQCRKLQTKCESKKSLPMTGRSLHLDDR
jgi:hypothetical protein